MRAKESFYFFSIVEIISKRQKMNYATPLFALFNNFTSKQNNDFHSRIRGKYKSVI